MKREGYFVNEMRIGVRDAGYVEAKIFIGGHHRQRLVVDVAGDAAFRHIHNDVRTLLQRDIRNTRQIEMA